jgi:hypothetical protein
MNLKTLFLVKIIFKIVAFITIIFLIENISDSYKKLEETNRTLLEQKKIYEQILKLENENIEVDENLYKIIEQNNLSLESDSKNVGFGIKVNIWILVIVLFILSKSFDYLNSKIEKLENEKIETEEENL